MNLAGCRSRDHTRDDEDRVDEPAYRATIRRLIAEGVDAVFVGGSAGEGPLLTDREWERMD